MVEPDYDDRRYYVVMTNVCLFISVFIYSFIYVFSLTLLRNKIDNKKARSEVFQFLFHS